MVPPFQGYSKQHRYSSVANPERDAMRFWPRKALLCAAWIAGAFVIIQPEARAASITGEVRFKGAVPNRPPIRVTKDQDYCGQRLSDESYLVAPHGGLKDVVVYVETPAPSTAHAGENKEHLLENRACRFVPRVMAIRWGERLVVRNSDPKLHIVHSYAEKRTIFNLSLPFQGQKIEITHKIKEPALLQVNCDTHGWMRAYVHVFGHPFFAVTDESGHFAIGDVPPGRYTLKAWHEEAGVRSQEVVAPEEGEIKVKFEFGR